jgi:hypothetical protein
MDGTPFFSVFSGQDSGLNPLSRLMKSGRKARDYTFYSSDWLLIRKQYKQASNNFLRYIFVQKT